MSKGSGSRNKAYRIPQTEYAARVAKLECPDGGFHDRDEDGLCRKCEYDRHPDLPPGINVSEAPT